MVQYAIDKMKYLKKNMNNPNAKMPDGSKLMGTFGKGGDFKQVKVTPNDEFGRPLSDLKSMQSHKWTSGQQDIGIFTPGKVSNRGDKGDKNEEFIT